ncbi:hypothetical protein IQ07DRAFT_355937 [Pyrenochaeta sp. DS3sAY3a]|nr:hypothetical protein IQ07DRAFT_355937 [Pyrenochaeta sp. DS3sAY3a]
MSKSPSSFQHRCARLVFCRRPCLACFSCPPCPLAPNCFRRRRLQTRHASDLRRHGTPQPAQHRVRARAAWCCRLPDFASSTASPTL